MSNTNDSNQISLTRSHRVTQLGLSEWLSIGAIPKVDAPSIHCDAREYVRRFSNQYKNGEDWLGMEAKSTKSPEYSDKSVAPSQTLNLKWIKSEPATSISAGIFAVENTPAPASGVYDCRINTWVYASGSWAFRQAVHLQWLAQRNENLKQGQSLERQSPSQSQPGYGEGYAIDWLVLKITFCLVRTRSTRTFTIRATIIVRQDAWTRRHWTLSGALAWSDLLNDLTEACNQNGFFFAKLRKPGSCRSEIAASPPVLQNHQMG